MKKLVFFTILTILLIIPFSFAIFGDVLSVSQDLSAPAVTVSAPANGFDFIEALIFTSNNEWVLMRSNTTNMVLETYDKNFKFKNVSFPLEHLADPVQLFNTDGANNGTHYYLLNRNIGKIHVFDGAYNFVANKTFPVADTGGITISWNGSTFLMLNVDGNLFDVGSDATGSTLLNDSMNFYSDKPSPLAQIGSNLYVGHFSDRVIGEFTSNGVATGTFFNDTVGTRFINNLDTNGSVLVSVLPDDDFFTIFDTSIAVIDTKPLEFVVTPAFGTTNPRSLAFDGTNWWLVDRSGFWFKYDVNFNVISSFSITDNGTNFRGGTVIGNNLYAFEQNADLIHVWTREGVWNFSFDPTPFTDSAGSVRGLTGNGTHLFLNNQLGTENGASIGIFELDGTYTGENLTLNAFGNGTQITNSDFTPSSDIVAIGGLASGFSHGFLLRYDISGVLQEAINFSTLGLDVSYPYGLEYILSSNTLGLLPRFSLGGFGTNLNVVLTLDAGILSGLPNQAPDVPTILTPTAGTTTLQPLPIEVLSNDPDGDTVTFEYYINDVLNQTSTTNTTLNASDGTFTLKVSATDGNLTSANASVTFTIDTQTPVIIATLPLNNSLVGTGSPTINPVTVDASCSDATSVFNFTYTLRNSTGDLQILAVNDTTPLTTLTLTEPLDVSGLPNGDYTLEFDCTDSFNTDTLFLNMEIDNSPETASARMTRFISILFTVGVTIFILVGLIVEFFLTSRIGRQTRKLFG